MNDLLHSSFRVNLILLRLVGLYPRKKHSKFYLVYAYVFLFCSFFLDPLLGLLHYINDEELTILDAGVSLVLMIAMLSYIPKMLPFITNNQKIRECLFYLDKAFIAPFNDKQKAITDDCTKICRRNFNCFFFCVFFNNLTLTFRPLLRQEHEFPVEVWLPFDATSNEVVYYSVYGFLALGIAYTVFCTTSVDALVTGLMFHAAGQVKILKNNLEFLEMSQNDVLEYQVIYRKIRECVHHHQTIISFVKQIEDCFSWVAFSQLFGSTLIICFCCLDLSQMELGNINTVLVGYSLGGLLQIYFYCYYGTTLYEESNSLSTAVYLGRWYEFDLKSQKALIVFMERAKIPMTVTAGKFLDLSLATFTNVLKKSYSLLAVLENY